MSTKKIALITGATSGIGKELAKCFAMNGYTIVIIARDEEKLKQTAKEFQQTYGADVQTIQADLSEPDASPKIFQALNGKTIDVLVNNAGFAPYGPFVANNILTDIGAIRLNVEAVTHLTRLILPDMVNRRSGKILNIASTASFQPGPLMAVYYATKAYVLSFSEALRYELKGTGVTVTTLCPGPTDTNFQKKSEFGKSKLLKMTGMMRADDVARFGYQAVHDGRSVAIPGFLNNVMAFFGRHSPRSIVLSIIANLNKVE